MKMIYLKRIREIYRNNEIFRGVEMKHILSLFTLVFLLGYFTSMLKQSKTKVQSKMTSYQEKLLMILNGMTETRNTIDSIKVSENILSDIELRDKRVGSVTNRIIEVLEEVVLFVEEKDEVINKMVQIEPSVSGLLKN